MQREREQLPRYMLGTGVGHVLQPAVRFVGGPVRDLRVGGIAIVL